MSDDPKQPETGTAPGKDEKPQEISTQVTEPTFTLTQAQLNALMAENKRNLLAEVEQLREKAAKWQEIEDKDKTEQQRLQEEMIKLKAASEKSAADLKQYRLQLTFEREAQKLGIVDTEAAFKLADVSGVIIGEDGTVTGVPETLTVLLQARPWLKGAKPTAPNINAGDGASADGASYSQQDIEFARILNITPERYLAQKREIEKRKQQGG